MRRNARQWADLWVGICRCHVTAYGMSGPILGPCSPDRFVNKRRQARLSDFTMGWCGHIGIIVTGSKDTITNNKRVARLTDYVVGCNIGVIITGSPDTITNEWTYNDSDTFVPDYVKTDNFKHGYSEVDYGNIDDDPDTDDGLNIYPPVTGSPTVEQIIRSNNLSVAPTTIIESENTIPPIQPDPPTIDCSSIPEPVPDKLQLTTNLNLTTLTTNAAISDYELIPQHGLTEKEIACNLLAWCQNIGEPLLAQHGVFTVTSGFRQGNSTSQHELGQAVDIQFPSLSNEEIYNISVWMKDNLNYDQLILEYGGNKPWIHISFNKSGNRSNTHSAKFGTRVSAGNYSWLTLINMA